jgi:hypothetical protein
MFSRFSNKNRRLKKPDNCAKTAFLLASDELTVLPSLPRKLGCSERTVLPEEPFLFESFPNLTLKLYHPVFVRTSRGEKP